MRWDTTRTRLTLILSFAGLAVAAAAGLTENVEWLGSLCGGMSEGCKETARFTLFGMPLWGWGIAFYLILAGLIFRAGGLVFWWVAAGFGMELGLMWIMFSMRLSCIFCLANLCVVTLILGFSFEKSRLWQTMAVSLSVFIVCAFVIPRENEAIASAAGKSRDAIAAKVKGRIISVAEVELPIALQLHEMEQAIHQKKMERLDLLITDMLLEEEAKRNGVTVQDLVTRKVRPQEVEVSDEEVEKYFEANREKWLNWGGPREEDKLRVKAYLRQEKGRKKVVDYSRSLVEKDEVIVYLKEPELPKSYVNIGNDPVWGPPNAPVTVVEFSDYECPVCRRTHETIKTIRTAYAGRIRWVFKDYPLRRHMWANKAAQAAHCAREQGKFWEYQDLLYGGDQELNPSRLKQYSRELGLEPAMFDRCLESGRYEPKIEKSVQEAKKSGVGAAPTFVINGRYYPSAPSAELFKELIEADLRRVK